MTYAGNPGAFVKTEQSRPELNITNPRTAQEHLNVAMERHYKRDLDGAIAEYKKSLELQPVSSLAHFRLGRAYQEKGDLDNAIAQWKLATRHDPHYYDAYSMLADAYRAKGDLESAAESYAHLLEFPPARMAVHYRVGFWYLELGDKPKAREHLESYIDLALNGKSKEPGTDRYEKAVRALEKLNASR
jgi:tetratricopeptide (TPR) repeat protein